MVDKIAEETFVSKDPMFPECFSPLLSLFLTRQRSAGSDKIPELEQESFSTQMTAINHTIEFGDGQTCDYQINHDYQHTVAYQKSGAPVRSFGAAMFPTFDVVL